MNGLMLHCGAEPISMEDLKKIPHPKPIGPRHKPLHHWLFMRILLECLTTFGLLVKKVELGIQGEDGARLFGLVHVEPDDSPSVSALRKLDFDPKSHVFQVGLRGANDGSLARYLIAGVGAFVCDNMCFSGDVVLLKKRQTTHLDIHGEINGSLGTYVEQTVGLVEGRNKAAALPVSDDAAKALIADLAFRHKAMPMRLMKEAYSNYFEPEKSWTDCRPRSYAGLYEAHTRAARVLKPDRKFKATQLLTNLLVEQPASNPDLYTGPVELLRRELEKN